MKVEIEKRKTEYVIPKEEIVIHIPQCCREGWDSCPHVVNRVEKKRKKNIGL